MASLLKQEETNWNRACRLLLEGGRHVLISFLENFWTSNHYSSLDAFLATHKTKLTSPPASRHIHPPQINILFPASGHTITDKWDITLAAAVVHSCVQPKTPGQWASLNDLRELGNNVHGHSLMGMTDAVFTTTWADVNKTLAQAAVNFHLTPTQSDLKVKSDRIKKEVIVDDDELRKELNAWYLSYILQVQTDVREAVRQVKKEVKHVTTYVKVEISKAAKEQQDATTNIKLEISKAAKEQKDATTGIQAEISKVAKEQNEASNVGIKTIMDQHEELKTGQEHILQKGTNLPLEILRMDDKAIELFRRALSDGKVVIHKIRVMLVGHSDVGKTTLLQRMLGKPVKIGQHESTDGIEVHVQKCQIDLATGKWTINKEDKGEVNPGKELLAKSLPGLLQSTVLGDRLPIQETQQPHVEHSLLSTTIDDESVDVDEKDGAWGGHDTDRFNTSTDIDAVPDNSEGQMFELSLEQSSSPVVAIDKTNQLKQMQEMLDECSQTTPSEEHAAVSFWDFAGQSIFYNTHQVFLAHRTIYLLVTRLDKDLDGGTHPDDSSGYEKCCSKEFVDFWVDSIHYFCEQENKKGPPVILVATHADTLNSTTREECINSHFHGIREIFLDKVTAEHFQNERQFAIDNTIEDEEVDKLKKAIFEVAKEQHYWAEQLPIRWFDLEQELFKLKDKKKIMKLEEVEALNRSLTVPLQGNDELQLFLCFQNDVGNFLYKRDEKLKNHLLLDPKWVSDALKCIITAPYFHRKKMKIGTALKELQKMGKLQKEVFDIVWEEAEFKEHSEFLLELMQNLNLIARLDQSDQSADPAFFVPSCITSKSPANDLRPKNLKHSSILILKVPSNFFPIILFNQLIAVCIKKYSIVKKGKHYCIYSGCAEFILGEAHTFTLYYIGHVVKIWVSKGGKEKLSSKKCQDVLKNVQLDMETILDSCRKEAKVKVFACCPEVELNENPEDLIELASDVEEWQREADKEHTCDHVFQHTYTVKDSLHGWINSVADHSDLSREPTDKELARIASKIGKEYKRFAIFLGLSTPEIDQIMEENKISVIDQTIEFLKLWKQKNGTKATLLVLEKCMKECELDSNVIYSCLDSS